MITILIIAVFVIGYIAIILEHAIKVNKAATALITGVLCWTLFILSAPDVHTVNESLLHQFSEIASILFFLLGAMVIVEVVDSHDGFTLITDIIKTTNKGKLLIIISFLTFFLSALLDNLTTTIVMISLIRKILSSKHDKWIFGGMIVIAANSGGAWSPLGDVTTTMLWIGGQITAPHIIASLFVPSLVAVLVPLIILWFRYKDKFLNEGERKVSTTIPDPHRNIIFFTGIGCLIFVPVFKTVTHLPPFMGMMLALGIIWLVMSNLDRSYIFEKERPYSVSSALERIDTPSILFFLGILLAVSALSSVGILGDLAAIMSSNFTGVEQVSVVMGLVSAIFDNVPLVAAAQGMYSLHAYPQDHLLWTMLAFTTGTGGSALIIGSAAGVAAMGMEKIDFAWYLKKISWLALLGFFAGIITIIILH